MAMGGRMLRTKARLIFAVALGMMIATTMYGQSLTVTVVTTKSKVPLSAATSKVSLSAAHILYDSSKGYAMGSAFQEFPGLYVTDPVTPPESTKLKPDLVPWNELRSVEFTDWDSAYMKANITLASGSVREVFLWNPSSKDSFSPLGKFDLKITGTLIAKGKERNAEFDSWSARPLKSLELETPKKP